MTTTTRLFQAIFLRIMGSCSSVPAAAALAPQPDFAQALLASGEFIQLGTNFVPANPTIFECYVTTVVFEWHPIKGECIYSCELTPEMDAAIAVVQQSYPQIDIRHGARLFVMGTPWLPPLETALPHVPSLNPNITKINVSMYLIRHPHYTNTLQVGWRFIAAAAVMV